MMGIPAETLREAVNHLADREPAVAQALATHGHPLPRARPRGYETLLRTIVGQQISIKAAASIWAKLETTLGDTTQPEALLAMDDEALRGAGLSRGKIIYARSLAEHVANGTLNLAHLPDDDEAAIARLIAIKGIGRWSAEIYLLFAEGRTDIWPAGDLAIQIAVGRIMGWPERPSERETRLMAEPWRPHRGSAAIFAWHCYNNATL